MERQEEGFDKPAEYKIFKAHGAQKAEHTRRIRAFRASRNAENHERRRFCKAFKKKIAAQLKAIYETDTLELAKANLEQFAETYANQYPHVTKSCKDHWDKLLVFFDYAKDYRRSIYTTNAIELLKHVIRREMNKRKGVPIRQSSI